MELKQKSRTSTMLLKIKRENMGFLLWCSSCMERGEKEREWAEVSDARLFFTWKERQ